MALASSTRTSPRVLVADDSGFMRRIIGDCLTKRGFTVIGSAADGDEALKLWRSERPDCMTLDLAMPGRDGMAVLRELKSSGGSVPVVVVSAFSAAHGAKAVDALAEGAFDLVEKPAIGEDLDAFADTLVEKVGAAARSPRAQRVRTLAPPPRRPAVVSVPAIAPSRPAATTRRRVTRTPRAVLIASSTGGPRALAELMPQLPSPLGAGVAIVQHMPQGFTRSLAERLDRACTLRVVEASGGEMLAPDTVLLAPGGRHLRFGTDRRFQVTDTEPIGALRPRADLTIEDAAAVYGDRLLLVVLTGMGRDGTAGAEVVKARGGHVLVEAEESCTVYGMPRSVAEAGLADAVLPLSELPAAIAEEAWC